MKVKDLKKEIKEAVLAWDSIKEDNEQFDDGLQEERKKAVDAWNSIKGMQYPEDKKFIETYFDETDIFLNTTTNKMIKNTTDETNDNDMEEGSGESLHELVKNLLANYSSEINNLHGKHISDSNGMF